MFKKLKLPKMPKIKWPEDVAHWDSLHIDVVGKAKDLTKKVGAGVKSGTKSAAKGIKGLNPFKK
jgi:hypothetical protein